MVKSTVALCLKLKPEITKLLPHFTFVEKNIKGNKVFL